VKEERQKFVVIQLLACLKVTSATAGAENVAPNAISNPAEDFTVWCYCPDIF
jgi:hypothetical protein